MSEVRQVPRYLMVLAVTLVIAGCAARQMPEPSPMPFRSNPCASGKARSTKQAPIVCVDDSARTLKVVPDPVVVHDVSASDRATPVTMQWFTMSGAGDVQIEIEPGCVTDANCNGNGHCTAKTVPGAHKQCKYDVWITGGNHDRLDPTVVVDGCCS